MEFVEAMTKYVNEKQKYSEELATFCWPIQKWDVTPCL